MGLLKSNWLSTKVWHLIVEKTHDKQSNLWYIPQKSIVLLFASNIYNLINIYRFICLKKLCQKLIQICHDFNWIKSGWNWDKIRIIRHMDRPKVDADRKLCLCFAPPCTVPTGPLPVFQLFDGRTGLQTGRLQKMRINCSTYFRETISICCR